MKDVQTGDPKTKIVNIFCFARLNSILIYEKASSSKTNFSNNPGVIIY